MKPNKMLYFEKGQEKKERARAHTHTHTHTHTNTQPHTNTHTQTHTHTHKRTEREREREMKSRAGPRGAPPVRAHIHCVAFEQNFLSSSRSESSSFKTLAMNKVSSSSASS